ncbi:MAG: chorismate synthase [Clostridia bacterium]|nr:chorismate synthase [Clostridia bacterium]
MSIFKGKNLCIEVTGTSHGESVKASVKGFPAYEYDNQKLNAFMERRKASSSVFSTPRKEPDELIFNGALNNKIDGDFEIEIKNVNVKSKDYNELYAKPRPSHADYAWYLKDGALDFSGGGRFSARLTAPLNAVGGLCKQYLEDKGVSVVAYLQSVGSVSGRSYKNGELSLNEIISLSNGFPSLDKKEEMLNEIALAKREGDSVGAIIECVVYGAPAGVGDNLFSGLEGKIASLLYAIPAVKGVEFGSGFEMCAKKGSEVNDSLYYENGEVKLKTNNNGGINGGISNGFLITMRVAIKPTPSIFKEQDTIDLVKKENVKIKINGRHDACVAVRAVPLVESAVCIALIDEII